MYSEGNPKQHTYKGDIISNGTSQMKIKNIRHRKLAYCGCLHSCWKLLSEMCRRLFSIYTYLLKDFEPKVKLLCSQWSKEMGKIWQMTVCLTVASWVCLVGGRPVVKNWDRGECWGWWGLGHAASCVLSAVVKPHVMKEFSTVNCYWWIISSFPLDNQPFL